MSDRQIRQLKYRRDVAIAQLVKAKRAKRPWYALHLIVQDITAELRLVAPGMV